MHISLRKLLLMMAGLTLISVLALGAMAIWAARTGAESLSEVQDKAVAPMALLQSVAAQVKEVRFRIAGVALDQLPTVGSANHLKEVEKSLPADWARFRESTRNLTLPEDQSKQLETIDAGMQVLNEVMKSLFDAYQNDDLAKVRSILEDDWPIVHAKVVKPIEQFMPFYSEMAQALYEESRSRATQTTFLVTSLLIVVSLLLASAYVFFISRLTKQLGNAQASVSNISKLDLSHTIKVSGQDEISELLRELDSMQSHLREVVMEVRQGADDLGGMVGGLATASRDVAGASAEQANAASDMAQAMDRLTQSINQVREHATESRTLAERSGQASSDGLRITSLAAQEMAIIAQGARESSATVAELGQLSGEITGIVSVIREIAEQTNLLALNAAIEAARAGEQGRGFAVVADEVRKLAERTSSSTSQIGDMINRIQNGTKRAVEAMETGVSRAVNGEELAKQAGTAIAEIEQRTRDVVTSVNEIHATLGQQSVSAGDIANKVEGIARMTETNSSASQQTSSAANQVSNLAARLSNMVAGFKV